MLDPFTNSGYGSGGALLAGPSLNQSSSSLQGISGIYVTNNNNTSSNPYIDSSTSSYAALIKGGGSNNNRRHPSTRRLTEIPSSVLPLVPAGESNKKQVKGMTNKFKKQRNEERMIPQVVRGDI